MNKQVLILSFWNPTDQNPQQGIFIQDQAAAVCSQRENTIFLQVNVLPSDNLLLRKEVIESAFFNNRRLTINLYSVFWKFYYVNTWNLTRIVRGILNNSFPEIKPELIHSNVIFPCGIVAYLLSQKTCCKTVISEHWSKAEKLLKHPLYRKIALKAYKKNSSIICVSKFLASKIEHNTGFRNITVIPNIVDTSLFSYKPKNEFDGTRLICTCVASWKLPKRLDLIIDSLSEFAGESGCRICLNVVGDGLQVDSMKARKIHDNLSIKWHGYLDKSSIVSLLNESHLFLHASEIETFSIVTAEALSTGTPVLASNTGALPELIHEQNGMLAENNVSDWIIKEGEIIKKKYDYEAIARENQNRFSPETTGKAILEVYNKVLNDM